MTTPFNLAAKPKPPLTYADEEARARELVQHLQGFMRVLCGDLIVWHVVCGMANWQFTCIVDRPRRGDTYRLEFTVAREVLAFPDQDGMLKKRLLYDMLVARLVKDAVPDTDIRYLQDPTRMEVSLR